MPAPVRYQGARLWRRRGRVEPYDVEVHDGSKEAIVVPPGGGCFFGNVEFLARTEDTTRFNMAIVTLTPNSDGPPVHTHQDEDDAFYILSGELQMEAAERSLLAGPGTFILIPPGVQHSFSNRTAREVRFINIHAPAGFDQRIMESD